MNTQKFKDLMLVTMLGALLGFSLVGESQAQKGVHSYICVDPSGVVTVQYGPCIYPKTEIGRR